MIEQEELHKTFKWNAERGRLEWRAGRPGVREGMPAGGVVGGGLYVTYNWQRVPVRNIVYALANGYWPPNRVKTIDGNWRNVSPDNLTAWEAANPRDVTLRRVADKLVILEGKTIAATYTLAEVDAALDHAAALLVS